MFRFSITFLDRCARSAFHVLSALIFVMTLLGVSTTVAQAGTATPTVTVNGQVLDDQVVTSYRIPAGRYWYDAASGLWGLEGQPVSGMIASGLQIGGPLRADASHGTSGTFFNGRELTLIETSYLKQRFGYVLPGRFWLNAWLYGGYEGGPTLFYLGNTASSGTGSGSNHSGVFGNIMSDGNCTFAHLPGGASVGSAGC